MSVTQLDYIEEVEIEEETNTAEKLTKEVYILPNTDLSIWILGISSWILLLFLLVSLFGYF